MKIIVKFWNGKSYVKESRKKFGHVDQYQVPIDREVKSIYVYPLNKEVVVYTRTRKRERDKAASRELQHQRYIDCGPTNWDDR